MSDAGWYLATSSLCREINLCCRPNALIPTLFKYPTLKSSADSAANRCSSERSSSTTSFCSHSQISSSLTPVCRSREASQLLARLVVKREDDVAPNWIVPLFSTSSVLTFVLIIRCCCFQASTASTLTHSTSPSSAITRAIDSRS
mmetsp:Transcript_36818/g.63555  ORF Transcript_36818/g.63555 Transcript_36818/m.63555 type:complete len:145 (-) Transcript_36818:121-555(-)